ncbi:MAG: DUF86 domain-containing protein [Chloroflexota bacterium]
MSKRPPHLLIEDIWEAIARIERYVAGMTAKAFLTDDKTSDAVARNLEIIGEAANRLSDNFKQEHQTIEWPKIVGLRHRIVHDYFGIDREIIWQIVREDLPKLKSKLRPLRREPEHGIE